MTDIGEGENVSNKPPLGDHEYAKQWARDTLSGRAEGGKFAWGERNLARAYLNRDTQIATLRAALESARKALSGAREWLSSDAYMEIAVLTSTRNEINAALAALNQAERGA